MYLAYRVLNCDYAPLFDIYFSWVTNNPFFLICPITVSYILCNFIVDQNGIQIREVK